MSEETKAVVQGVVGAIATVALAAVCVLWVFPAGCEVMQRQGHKLRMQEIEYRRIEAEAAGKDGGR